MEIKTHIFSVSEINAVIKDVLEEAFPEAWIKGEISNLKNYSNHLFFTLKDEKSQLRTVLFRGHHSKLRFSPRDGMSVLVRGNLSLYEARGEFQLMANYMEPLGVGTLRLAFEELKKKLADKGYFDEKRKRPLPELPRTIGVITSPKGAVIQDILNILKRRFFNMHIIIFPVKVQGEGAKEEISEAIHFANRHCKNIDVIIIARGGGSLEDLWAFNEEVVADAIFNSAIPVISAVGHETDFTIADFVADLRAPTPSAAAELVVRKKDDLEAALQQLYHRMKIVTMRHFAAIRSRLESEHRILRSPLPRIRQNILLVSDLQDRLQGSAVNTVAGLRRDIAAMNKTLHLASPSRKLGLIRAQLDALGANIIKTARYGLSHKQGLSAALAGKLETLSPLKILSRGYSIALTIPDQKVLKDSKQVSKGAAIKVRLREGSIRCTVDDREENS